MNFQKAIQCIWVLARNEQPQILLFEISHFLIFEQSKGLSLLSRDI